MDHEWDKSRWPAAHPELPGSGNERTRCMAALLAFIRKDKAGAFRSDFPFGLPRDPGKEDRWRDFVVSFSFRYTSTEDFRKAPCTASGGFELKCMTDRTRQTPFSPYNLQLYRDISFQYFFQRLKHFYPMGTWPVQTIALGTDVKCIVCWIDIGGVPCPLPLPYQSGLTGYYKTNTW